MKSYWSCSKFSDWVDKKDPHFGKPTSQALAAQETLALYTWWKEERPKRLDPFALLKIECGRALRISIRKISQ